MTLSSQKGVGHASAHHQEVHPVEQGLEDPELVGDLGPTHHGDERAGRAAEQRPEHLDLPLEEEAGGTGQPGGRTDHRGVAAVGDPKASFT